MKEVKGTPVAAGLALGRVFMPEFQTLEAEYKKIATSDLPEEKEKLEKGLEGAKREIEILIADAVENAQEEQHAIFECYLELVHDQELTNDINSFMEKELVSIETALSAVCADYVSQMEAVDDPYLQARGDDFKQVFRMIKSSLYGGEKKLNVPKENFILAAREIGPAEMAMVDKTLLQGFVLESGSKTSHAAIISRAMDIPMISGIKNIKDILADGQKIALDGETGVLYIDPENSVVNQFNEKICQVKQEKAEIAKLVHEKALTADGIHITLYANIGTVGELSGVLESNADGIGLFRTEFLFMENGGQRLPTEEEQFRAYKTILEGLQGKPCIFRTLDAGGDKKIEALGIPSEENPFLGWRAIRYCLKRPDVFRTQLRALLRASNYGNEKIMLPMIISEKEVIETREILDQLYIELEKEGQPVAKRVPLGIMIETPAAAVNAENLAKVSDFFSLGTNDLTQYTLAVDRGNEQISDLYDEGHPAVLSLIAQVIAAGNKAGIPVDACGEMAGDSRFTQALLKCGLREFSMSPVRILKCKKNLRSLRVL